MIIKSGCTLRSNFHRMFAEQQSRVHYYVLCLKVNSEIFRLLMFICANNVKGRQIPGAREQRTLSEL